MARDDPYSDPPRLPEGDIDLSTLLPGDGPIEIEIGPGRGAFIMERAAEVPTHRLIGLEIRRKYACIVDERLAARGMGQHARVFCEDARLALPRMGPEGCLARAFILFPDPWWKKRHAKRLVVVDPVIVELGRLLADGGELFVQTDVPERADEYEQRLSAAAFLEPAGDDGARSSDNPYGSARTNREKHADRDGLPVHRLLYRRRPR